MVFEQYIQNEYLRALVLLIVLLFLIRGFLFILEKFFLRVSKKTKTDVDDVLVKILSKPLTILAFLISLQISIRELVLEEGVSQIVDNLIFSLTIIVVAFMGYVIVDVAVVRVLKKAASKTKSSIDDSLISLFHSVLKIALFVISALYILSIWGVEITPLLAGLGIAGLAIALALQPVLSNVFSGAAIVLDHTVRVGDLVYLDQQTKGKIEKIGLRSTKIRTFDNELVIVPNNKLAESKIQNVALPEPKSRAVIPFGVAYGTDVDKVKKIITRELKSLKHVEKDPKPVVRFLEMAESSLNFKAYFYVDTFENRFESIDEANTKIYNALNKNKIEIPFPQRDVHIKGKSVK